MEIYDSWAMCVGCDGNEGTDFFSGGDDGWRGGKFERELSDHRNFRLILHGSTLKLMIRGIRSILICLLLVGCHSNVETLELNEAAHMAYLSDRFADAYSREPAIVAIWEGTHFEAWLNKNFPADTAEKRAARVLLHSRLSQLYKETGENEKAEIEAQRAKHFLTNSCQTTASVTR